MVLVEYASLLRQERYIFPFIASAALLVGIILSGIDNRLRNAAAAVFGLYMLAMSPFTMPQMDYGWDAMHVEAMLRVGFRGEHLVEAVCRKIHYPLGALYLDQGMKAVDNILNDVITPRLAHPDDLGFIQDYKTKLQELIQMDSSRTLHYQLVSEKGPANAPEFVMNVIVDGLVLGTGKGVSKKQAEQNAARNAFEKLAK